jgi:hypothetical protein
LNSWYGLNDAHGRVLSIDEVIEFLNYGFSQSDIEGSQIGVIKKSEHSELLGLFALRDIAYKGVVGHFQGIYSFAMDEEELPLLNTNYHMFRVNNVLYRIGSSEEEITKCDFSNEVSCCVRYIQHCFPEEGGEEVYNCILVYDENPIDNKYFKVIACREIKQGSLSSCNVHSLHSYIELT